MHNLDGVLFFPVTPFGSEGELNLDALEEHIRAGLAADPRGVFVACGTGEFHALTLDEYAQVVQRASTAVRGQCPVFAGVGGALPLARQFAFAARDNGADGLLLFPPYLVSGPPAGMRQYASNVAWATSLPLILYNRGSASYDVDTVAALAQISTIVGFKDGRGDLLSLFAIMQAVREAIADTEKPFQFFNGTPTAEVTAAAYRKIGVNAYSSAVFCFIPELSTLFYKALVSANESLIRRILTDFFEPFVQLRDEVPGYAISLVKAGVRLSGIDVGGVRAPLVDPTYDHLNKLASIIERGRRIIAERKVPDGCLGGSRIQSPAAPFATAELAADEPGTNNVL